MASRTPVASLTLVARVVILLLVLRVAKRISAVVEDPATMPSRLDSACCCQRANSVTVWSWLCFFITSRSRWLPVAVLLLSGDVHLNPGPHALEVPVSGLFSGCSVN